MLRKRKRLLDKPVTAIIPPSYFQNHECHLPDDKMTTFGVQISRWKRMLLNFTTVRTNDLRARNMFKSYAALSAEKYRQYLEHPLSIHPYSMLRLCFEVLYVISTTVSNTMLSLNYVTNPSEWGPAMLLLYFSEGFILFHMVANFFTGYVKGNTYNFVILEKRKVFLKYIRTWFIVDLVSALSIMPILVHLDDILLHAILVSTRLVRMPQLMMYQTNINKALKFGIISTTCIDICVLIYSYVIWNIFFLFAIEYIIEGSYTPANPRKCSWLSVSKLWNASFADRFTYSLEKSVGTLRKNEKMDFTIKDECLEVRYVMAWIIAKILIYHCGLKYIIAMYGRESAAAKYFTMTKQVEMYMNQRKLPPRLKKKILKFYAIRYQSCFFVEAPILSCVSGQLREDIIMQSGRQLVRQLEFLEQLPRALLLRLSFKLKLVIFIAGDIIYKINAIGDCLYFIDKGTVAVYSGSGKEVCHLDDGDFFGEIALAMKNRFRTTSVVAVTNCELFRLDREDFNSSIALFPSVYEHIKKVATHRQERTTVIDEHHNVEIRNVESSSKENISLKYQGKKGSH